MGYRVRVELLCGVLGCWAVQMGEEVFASGTNNKKQEVVFGEDMRKSLLVGLPVWGLELGRS